MIELYAWLSIHAVAADEDMLAHSIMPEFSPCIPKLEDAE